MLVLLYHRYAIRLTVVFGNQSHHLSEVCPYIFGLSPGFWHRRPQTLWNFLNVGSYKGVCYVNEVALGKHLRVGGGQENQPCD